MGSGSNDEICLSSSVLLHEIAHALCRHRSPTRDKLTQEEFQAQEDEADNLAIDSGYTQPDVIERFN